MNKLTSAFLRCRSYLLAILISGALVLQGCSYMEDRGRDAMDVFDVGLTFSPPARPGFSLYIDFFNMIPMGYANVTEAKILGIAYRQAGWLDYQAQNWGVLAWGSEKQGAGLFNVNDPRHAHPGADPSEPWPRWDAGFVRVFSEDNPPPKFHYMECTRQIHLGWVGFLLDIRPIDLVDFLVGWTTYDLLGDDNIAPPETTATGL